MLRTSARLTPCWRDGPVDRVVLFGDLVQVHGLSFSLRIQRVHTILGIEVGRAEPAPTVAAPADLLADVVLVNPGATRCEALVRWKSIPRSVELARHRTRWDFCLCRVARVHATGLTGLHARRSSHFELGANWLVALR